MRPHRSLYIIPIGQAFPVLGPAAQCARAARRAKPSKFSRRNFRNRVVIRIRAARQETHCDVPLGGRLDLEGTLVPPHGNRPFASPYIGDADIARGESLRRRDRRGLLARRLDDFDLDAVRTLNEGDHVVA